MGLTSGVKQWYIKSLPGMNNKVEELETQDKWVKLAQNCRFDVEPGSVTKREPISFYNTTTMGVATPVVGTYRYYTKGGTKKAIFVCGTKAYVGTDSNGATAEIRTGLTDGKRPCFKVYQDILIVSNGENAPWCYDGSTDNITWELGSCKAKAASGGTNLGTGTYKYKVTFIIGGIALVNNAASNTVTTTANQKIELSHIPFGPDNCTSRKIYRTEVNGSSYKLLTTITDGSISTYTDDVADGTLGASMPDTTDAIPKGSIMTINRERLFIAGDPNYPNRIYYSDPYLPWFMAHVSYLRYMDIDADDGDQIMGIPIQMGTMCCVKKNNIRKLAITSATSGADPNSWYADDPISFVGTPAQWSIVQTPYGFMFLGWDHWYSFDGVNATPIMDEFDTSEILGANYSDVVAHWSQKGVLLWAYTDASSGATYHNRVGRFDLKRQALEVDVIANDTSGRAHGVNCFMSFTGGDEEGELYYGSSTHGFVYKAEQSQMSLLLTTQDEVNLGTLNTIFVGGTASSPTIEIGASVSAETIPNGVCIFWDNPDSTPGTGWTEIVDQDDRFVKVSTSAVGTAGTVGTSKGDVAPIRYFNYRMFKADSCATTEFPNGAIVMYNQPSDPTGWQAQDYGYYVKINTDLTTWGGELTAYPETSTGEGETLDNEAKFRFIKKIAESATWDGDLDKKVYCPSYDVTALPTHGFTDVTTTYTGKYIKSAEDDETPTLGGAVAQAFNMVNQATTTHSYLPEDSDGAASIDEDDDTCQSDAKSIEGAPGRATASVTSLHTFAEPTDIATIYYKAKASADDGGFAEATSCAVSISYDNQDNWTVIFSGTGARWETTFTGTVSTGWSAVTDIKIVTTAGAGSGASINANAHAMNYEIQARANYKTTTVKLCSAVLGKMKAWNNALTSTYTAATWLSPTTQLDVITFGRLHWNESRGESDDVQLFLRTGATSSAVTTGVACVIADNGSGKIQVQDVAHGLANGNRVTFDWDTVPTGISKNYVYYVVNKADNTFEIALTSGGTAVAYSAAGTSVTYRHWANAYTNPNGSTVLDTAGVWAQYLVALIAADSTLSNASVYYSDGFVVKLKYDKARTLVEPAVAYKYEIGMRNFNEPGMDKIFKKITAWHKADEDAVGSYYIFWKVDIDGTDNLGVKYREFDGAVGGNKSFVIPLSTNKTRWESFFPSIATGREISFYVYKNDLENFTLKELRGIYSGEPVII